jgi:hypothetical protein
MALELPSIPDMEGWLYKQGDKYKNWNKRWFVLKANNLFYFKSPKVKSIQQTKEGVLTFPFKGHQNERHHQFERIQD